MDLKSWKSTFIRITFLLILSLTRSMRITVKECPVTEITWKARSQIVTCETSKVYHCIQDHTGKLIETCMVSYKVRPFREDGCPWVYYSTDRGSFLGGVFYSCEGTGCPQKNDSDYWTNELYKYPVCLHYNEAITDVTDSTVTSYLPPTHATVITVNDMNETVIVINVIVTTIAVVMGMLWIATVLAWKYRRRLHCGKPLFYLLEAIDRRHSSKYASSGSDIVTETAISRGGSINSTQMQEHDKDNRYQQNLSTRDKYILRGVNQDLNKALHEVGGSILHLLCLEGKINLVKCLMEHLENSLYIKDKNGCTPFHLAGFSGSIELVQHIMEKGGDLYSKDNDGRTIVHNACQKGHINLVKHLIDKDEGVLKVKDNNGLTPFHFAGFSGSLELVQYLIDNGCDLYSKDKNGQTIVHYACQEGHINLVKHVMKKDRAVLNIKDNNGMTPFLCAGLSGSVELAQYLIDNGCDVYSKDDYGWNIVHIACGKGHVQLVEYLISLQKDIIGMRDKKGLIPFYCKEESGWTILHKACFEGHVGLVQKSIEFEKDILNGGKKLGMPPFKIAGYAGSVKLKEFLVVNGFDSYSKDKDGQTIIHRACAMDHTNLINIDNEILTMKEIIGTTPFHCAGYSGSVELVQYLIENGCYMYSKDNVGRIIVHIACQKGHVNLVKHLTNIDKAVLKIKDNKGLTPFHCAGLSGSVELVQYLIDNGCDVNSKDDVGQTIVHYACYKGHIKLVKHLINMDKSVLNIEDNKGRTPFHCAGFSGSIELVQYLMAKGGVLHSKDSDGRTIVHNACSEGHLGVMRCLSDRDESIIHVKDNSGQTPLSLARKYFANA